MHERDEDRETKIKELQVGYLVFYFCPTSVMFDGGERKV